MFVFPAPQAYSERLSNFSGAVHRQVDREADE
jgi:hypothetical protein